MTLSATDINQAFDALSEELANAEERAEIVIVGGAALVLLFGARETTKDVDAFFVKPMASVIREAGARVAGRLNLPEDWLNDGAKGFLVGLTEGEVLYESQYLLARAVSTAQLLAMKLAVWAAVEPLVPPPQLDKASYAFQDLWEAVHGTT